MDPGITGRTRFLGLIAAPVVQARAPAMANALLAERGRFGAFVLLPLEVTAAGLADVTRALRHVASFAGAIVSMPHKTAIVPLLDDVTPEARLVGAVNVIRRTVDARLVGTVLDGEGFVAGLRGAGHEVAGRRCLLVGAGGAAAAIAVALAQHGCAALAIVNRTPAKAAALAERVRRAVPGVAVGVGDDPAARWDVAVNATSLGMRPDDPLPMSDDVLRRTALVAECVLAPETTALLARAAALGCRVHGGVPMLAAQMDLMLRCMGVD